MNLQANQCEGLKCDIDKHMPTELTSCFLNIATFQGKWKSTIDGKPPVMKVYNSFSYTEDIKYEARLLELPLQDKDMKFVITVPNEKETLPSLVTTLTDKGLEETVNSIQPLFTACSVMMAPEIKFDSEMVAAIDESRTAIQYGGINVNENGVSAKELTCLFKDTHGINSSKFEGERTSPYFFFAVTFKGTAIFTGNFTPKENR